MATKTANARTLQSSTTNTAGSSTDATELDLSSAVGGAIITAKITNGATGPTDPCEVIVYTGHATGTKKEFARLQAGTDSGEDYEFTIEIPPSAMFVNITFDGNTGEDVTVEAFAQEYTSIS